MDSTEFDYEPEVTTGLEKKIRQIIKESYWDKLFKFINDSGGGITFGGSPKASSDFRSKVFHNQNSILIKFTADKIMEELMQFDESKEMLENLVKKAKEHTRGKSFMNTKRRVKDVFTGNDEGSDSERPGSDAPAESGDQE